MYDMYSQEFTLCYWLVKSVLHIPFKVCLRHQSVTLFLCGAPTPKTNPGSAPAYWYLLSGVLYFAILAKQ